MSWHGIQGPTEQRLDPHPKLSKQCPSLLSSCTFKEGSRGQHLLNQLPAHIVHVYLTFCTCRHSLCPPAGSKACLHQHRQCCFRWEAHRTGR